jgi:hypothetical protein
MHVGFVVHRVSLRQVLLKVLRFSPSAIFLSHLLSQHWRHLTSATDDVVKLHNKGQTKRRRRPAYSYLLLDFTAMSDDSRKVRSWTISFIFLVTEFLKHGERARVSSLRFLIRQVGPQKISTRKNSLRECYQFVQIWCYRKQLLHYKVRRNAFAMRHRLFTCWVLRYKI